MAGRWRQIAQRSACEAARGPAPGWVCATAAAVPFALALSTPSAATEAEAVATVVGAASAVTATSAMVADLAALESAYVDARPAPLATRAAVRDARQAGASARFDALPRRLAAIDPGAPDALAARDDVAAPILMLARPELGPLVLEQPMRVYENDVTVKLRAPGRRRSFATFEVTF